MHGYWNTGCARARDRDAIALATHASLAWWAAHRGSSRQRQRPPPPRRQHKKKKRRWERGCLRRLPLHSSCRVHHPRPYALITSLITIAVPPHLLPVPVSTGNRSRRLGRAPACRRVLALHSVRAFTIRYAGTQARCVRACVLRAAQSPTPSTGSSEARTNVHASEPRRKRTSIRIGANATALPLTRRVGCVPARTGRAEPRTDGFCSPVRGLLRVLTASRLRRACTGSRRVGRVGPGLRR
ncbi:hypothetical protein C2E23DRAFT_817953 [Lenzites betulinus]|nr:hypothetical protein C2E23DRAFT_817953 [Lenzites betulinus]